MAKDRTARVSDPAPRCSIPTLAQGDLEPNPAVLRTVAGYNSVLVPALGGEVLPCAGVYGFVVRGGTVRRGDPVRVL